MTPAAGWMTSEQEQQISAEIARASPRLRSFVRRRVADAADAEDILQDVLAELVESYRLPRPVEQVSAWLYRVARNRITDFFRKKRPESFSEAAADDDEEPARLDELLPAPEGGPEAAYARRVLLEELDAALAELPAEQRDVFIANELEGERFIDIAARTGVPLNTLLARKRYAVLHLRERLREIHDEFMQAGD
jgi:RNA polymerase sigma factor (sigma-70 family)